MYFSFLMVRTENHSGGTKYTCNPWMTTNTRRLQRIAPVLRRSSLRCLLPSVYELMASSQRDRDLSLKRRSQATALCSDFCIRIKLWHCAARGQVPATRPSYISTDSVLRITNAWTVDPTMKKCHVQSTTVTAGRDGGQNSKATNCKPGFVWWPSYLHSWSMMHLFSNKKKKAKITSAIPVCHHSNVCFLQCAINEGNRDSDINLFKAKNTYIFYSVHILVKFIFASTTVPFFACVLVTGLEAEKTPHEVSRFAPFGSPCCMFGAITLQAWVDWTYQLHNWVGIKAGPLGVHWLTLINTLKS